MPALGDVFSIEILRPSFDRWMYPFNATPGNRPVGSTFGYTPDPSQTAFDNRDGQVVIGFDTEELIETGLGIESYNIQNLQVTMSIANDVCIYDETYDPYTNFLPPSDPDATTDVDAGQSIELHGVGYRWDYDAFSFPENGPFGFGNPAAQSVRSLFPINYSPAGGEFDISNNVRERFDPKPWAIGLTDTVVPGEALTEGTVLTFQVDVEDPQIQAYIAKGLDIGRVVFCISSLTQVEIKGGNFPNFYLKENPLVDFDLASAATLAATIQIGDDPCAEPADINCDGIVNGEDLGAFLGAWGTDNPIADFNTDGLVDGVDLGYFLGKWGPVF
ncbi:MAG: hypothetical protein CMJ32_10510 [Phycisphaerae bacterium]|nr:hypothetical protein [Phycisphaerae bacterium]